MSIRAHSVQCKEGQDLLREEFEEIGHYTLNRSLSGMKQQEYHGFYSRWLLTDEAKKNWCYFYYPYFLGYRQKMGFSS
jgi:hypothetical protein